MRVLRWGSLVLITACTVPLGSTGVDTAVDPAADAPIEDTYTPDPGDTFAGGGGATVGGGESGSSADSGDTGTGSPVDSGADTGGGSGGTGGGTSGTGGGTPGTVPTGSCPAGQVLRCDGATCAPASWLGDGMCDGVLGMYCAATQWDGGDCPEDTDTNDGCDVGWFIDCGGRCARLDWIGDGTCDEAFFNLNCAATNFDGGDC